MSADPRFAVTLEGNDGNQLRFGPDEADPQNVVVDVSFGTEVPGWGFADGTVKLSRPHGLDSLDADLFAAAHVYDQSGRTVYRGRVAGVPRVGASEIELTLEGPLAHLDDDQAARVIYRDTDLGSWQEAGYDRKETQITSNSRNPIDHTTEYDEDGMPVLVMEAEGNWAATAQAAVEAWYPGNGLLIGKVAGTWTRTNASSTSWYWSISACDDAIATGYTGTGDLQSEPTASAAASQTWTPGKPFALLDFVWTGGALTGFESVPFRLGWSGLAVYGDHGLTIRGIEPDAGFYASDIVAHAVGRWAPLVAIEPNGIEQSAFVIPHLAFRDFGTTARNIIEAVSLFGASGFQPPDWGYYEDGFFWRTPGSYGRTWRVRRDEGVVSVDEGPTSESRCNGYVVQYTDANGNSRSVGPTGSGADYETDLLADTDPANPVNAAGIPKRYGSRDIGITNEDGAVLIGQLLLKDANTRRYSGSVELEGEAMDDAGNLWPVYLVRAGDCVIVEDDDDTTPRKIVSTSYSGGTVTATLDNKGASIDALLQRLDVAIKPAGF